MGGGVKWKWDPADGQIVSDVAVMHTHTEPTEYGRAREQAFVQEQSPLGSIDSQSVCSVLECV